MAITFHTATLPLVCVGVNRISMLLSMGVWNILALAIPLIVIIIGFSYLSRMR
jgi:hypothetical protein